MWPNKRVQNSALMRWEDTSYTGRTRTVRKRETRRMVTGGRPAQQPRKATR